MKMFLSFVCGAVVMLGFNAMRGANPSHHIYELRMYHVNQGKTEALQNHANDRYRYIPARTCRAGKMRLHDFVCFLD
jgi:hypothetical protein